MSSKQSVLRATFGAGGGQSTAVIQNQDINGLVVCTDSIPGATDYLTVTLRSSKHPSKVLVNRISCLALAAISDAEGGSSQGLQVLLNAGLAVGDFPFFAFAVDLGCLYMRANDSSLEIVLESAQAGVSNWSVSAYLHDLSPDKIVSWTQSNMLTDKAHDVDQVWVFNAAGNETLAPFSRDVTIQCGSMHGETNCSYVDLIGSTASLGSIEGQGPLYVGKLYDGPDELVGPVWWNVSGTEAADFRMIVKQVTRVSQRVSAGVVQQVNRMAERVSAMGPEVQQAYKRAGVIPGNLRDIHNLRAKLNIPGISQGVMDNR